MAELLWSIRSSFSFLPPVYKRKRINATKYMHVRPGNVPYSQYICKSSFLLLVFWKSKNNNSVKLKNKELSG